MSPAPSQGRGACVPIPAMNWGAETRSKEAGLPEKRKSLQRQPHSCSPTLGLSPHPHL